MDEREIDWSGCEFVERVPGRWDGASILVGSDLPVEAVLRNFAARRPDEIAWMFSVDEAQVRGVLRFAGYDPDEKKNTIDWTGCEFVERVRERMTGVPTLVGTRITPEMILDNYEDGNAAYVAEYFQLPIDQVRGVLAFAGRLLLAA